MKTIGDKHTHTHTHTDTHTHITHAHKHTHTNTHKHTHTRARTDTRTRCLEQYLEDVSGGCCLHNEVWYDGVGDVRTANGLHRAGHLHPARQPQLWRRAQTEQRCVSTKKRGEQTKGGNVSRDLWLWCMCVCVWCMCVCVCVCVVYVCVCVCVFARPGRQRVPPCSMCVGVCRRAPAHSAV